ncbi:hypothetical protein Desor_2330 [Desulfosporosinus orientis DSM 765]|uniref:Uncharacterized protein n=1 Tax=Desulfosporosinus orientis (strain ATCC 19365 / DSM 765 / NCIMB 8382 / VKM B-1628 / Singapore I) TaxID=768706 RepID=G7WDF2_DESOD|nr:hypothetical protein [Desulfosporosinus orientis]AET67921.1 hypothetical protein Desor_2330 [Desulfosporosinus orientis DSM 765]
MKKLLFTLVLMGSMLVSVGSAFASGNGACDRDLLKLHLRDGSCQTALVDQSGSGSGDCDQLRLQDGSCQTA